MAHFNYYRMPSAAEAADRTLRIVNPRTGMTWDPTANSGAGALAAAPTYANTAITLTHNQSLNGYPVTIPANLPDGEYDFQFYDVTPDSIVSGDDVEAAFSFKWSKAHGLMRPPRDNVTDRIK